jgi:hypothetical protein
MGCADWKGRIQALHHVGNALICDGLATDMNGTFQVRCVLSKRKSSSRQWCALVLRFVGGRNSS